MSGQLKVRPRSRGAKGESRSRRSDQVTSRRSIRFRVLELTTVDERSLEDALNQAFSEGWTFESVHFAMRESSRRPAMAFLTFAQTSRDAAADVSSRSSRVDAAKGQGAERAWSRLRELAEGR